MSALAASYNNQTSATLFAQFSGVMAGFAFTALVLILTFHREGGARAVRKSERQLIATTFFVAFASLIFATLMYTAVGGETYLSDRAATETILADIGFFIAMLHVFLGLMLLMKQLAVVHASRLAETLAGVIVPITGYAYVYQDAARAPNSQLLPFYWSLVFFVISMSFGFIHALHPLPKIPRFSIAPLNSLSLGYVCLCAVLVAIAQAGSTSFTLSGPLLFLLLFILGGVQGFYCYAAFSDQIGPVKTLTERALLERRRLVIVEVRQ